MNTFNHIYTKKIKIYPNKNQKEKFDFWLRRCKVLYNVALEEKISYYKVTGKYLNVYEQKKELVDIKDYDKTWNDIPNKSLQEIIFRLDKTYKSFFKGGGFPKFKKNIKSIEFVSTDVRFKRGLLYLPKIKESVKYKEQVDTNYSSIKLSKENDNYFLIFVYKKEMSVNTKNLDILGVDPGLMSLYTDSNGNKVKRFSKKLIKNYQNRIKNLNISLSNKNNGSKRFKKVKKQLNKTYKRLVNSRNDYLHKKSLDLVKCEEGIINLGDIKIQKIVESNSSKGS